MHLPRFAFFGLLCCLLVGALSQSGRPAHDHYIGLYQQGDKLYHHALQLSRQQQYNEAEEERLNRLALGKFTRLLFEADKQQLPPDTLQFFAAIKGGELWHYFDSFSKALAFYNKATTIQKRLPSLSDTALFKPYLFSGLIHYNQNRLDSALALLRQAERIQSGAVKPLQESERLYNILGSIYYEYGNYRLAKNYFQKAAEVLSPSHPSYNELLVNYQINHATSLFKLEDYDSANTIYRSLLPKTTVYLNHIYNNLGLIQLYVGAPKQALGYFRKVTYSNHLRIGLYNDMANAYVHLKQWDSARQYLSLALEDHQHFNPENTSIDHGRTLKLLGDWEREQGRHHMALAFYQKALHQFYPAFNDTAVRSNPSVFTGAFSYINLFHALVAKAETCYAIARTQSTVEWTNEELKTYQSAFGLIGYVEKTYESDEARLFLTKIKYAVHDKPIEAAYRLYRQTGEEQYLESLYQLDQQNKATTLALSRQVNLEAATENAPLLERELQVRSAISRLSIKAAGTADRTALAALNQAIRDQEIRLGKLQDSVNAGARLNEIAIPTIAQLKEGVLDKQTALLSYHLSETKLTTVYVTTTSSGCFQQDLPAGFLERINRYIHAVRTPQGNAAPGEDTAFYRLFLGGLPLQNVAQLIIIPDDVLAYLPFESLKTAGGRYLVQDKAVQYQYSTALLKKEKAPFTGAETLSFAPFTQASAAGSLPVLPHSKNEILRLKGKQFFDTAATKKNFLRQAGSFRILHLATHAVVNDKADNLSYIAFSPAEKDNRLYAQEIYTLPLQRTDLVILSACETGTGQLIQGEGVMSLSRAFRYAGCANVITTLWKADDYSTAYLTTRIHHYLGEGLPVALAVQAAKKDYLGDKRIHPRLKQPYFWSHLVFIGDRQEQKRQWWVWVAGLLAIGGLAFFLYRVSQRRWKTTGPAAYVRHP